MPTSRRVTLGPESAQKAQSSRRLIFDDSDSEPSDSDSRSSEDHLFDMDSFPYSFSVDLEHGGKDCGISQLSVEAFDGDGQAPGRV